MITMDTHFERTSIRLSTLLGYIQTISFAKAKNTINCLKVPPGVPGVQIGAVDWSVIVRDGRVIYFPQGPLPRHSIPNYCNFNVISIKAFIPVVSQSVTHSDNCKK